jgi:hypothetical protein
VPLPHSWGGITANGNRARHTITNLEFGRPAPRRNPGNPRGQHIHTSNVLAWQLTRPCSGQRMRLGGARPRVSSERICAPKKGPDKEITGRRYTPTQSPTTSSLSSSSSSSSSSNGNPSIRLPPILKTRALTRHKTRILTLMARPDGWPRAVVSERHHHAVIITWMAKSILLLPTCSDADRRYPDHRMRNCVSRWKHRTTSTRTAFFSIAVDRVLDSP